MKSSQRFLSFLLTGILLLACENEQQTWLSEMEGTPACTVPATIGKNLPVTISAGGITTPGNVAYTWNAPEFSPNTFTGTTFEAIAPEAAGEYHIFVTAHSAGYRDVTIKQKIIVVDCIPMTGHLDIIAPADVVKGETVRFDAIGITSPAEGITYEWHAPHFSSSYTSGGATFETQAPQESRTYTIAVTAKAENYCDTTIHKEITVKPGRKMQGQFDFTTSSPIIKGQEVTFAARGIITPTAEHISYEWLAPAFTEGTKSGNSYTATCPPTTGTYEVAVTAKATGYTDSTVRRIITVGDEWLMTGNISITVPPEVIISQQVTFHVTNNITLPSEGISFVWNAPHFNPITFESTGNTFTATAPASEGAYNISVTARAANYSGTMTEATVNVKGGMDMTGELDFNVPGQIVKDLKATFFINSTLATKDGSSITYEWDAPGFSAATFGGPTFTGIPATAGPHTIVLRAKAAGYTTVSVSKTIDVIDGLDMGNLTILADGGNSAASFTAGFENVTFRPVTDSPIPSATYTWSASSCTPNTWIGETYSPTLPSVAGDYTIKLTAEATGYLSKTATYTYNVACNPMTVGFNLTRTELLTGDVTTLTATSVNGASYEWIIPTGFAITDENSTSSSVTIKAPSTPLAHPATITLNAKAVNYCDASHTATITVKGCYPSTYTPVINSSATFENEAFHASNLQDVEFSTLPITPLRSGGTATYAWSFGAPPSSSRSFTPSNSPAATDNTKFVTKAPGHSTDVYNLTLQVAADGYCVFDPVSKPVVVDASKGALTGTIEISEVVAPTLEPAKPVLWIAKDRPVTLHAHYSKGSGEVIEELDLKFKWYWVSGSNYTLLGENDGTLNYTPQTEVHDNRIRVEVYDLKGKAATAKEYPYYVQNCSNNLLPGLHINVNYQCRVEGLRSSAFVMDSLDNHYIYKVTNIGGKWWLTENLRANKQNNAFTHVNYGAYYHASLVNDLGSLDGRYCPKGWRIPKKDEWNALNNAVNPSNNESVFNGLATSEMDTNPSVGSTAWNSSNVTNLPGSNAVGFNLIPAGIRYNSSITQWGNKAMFFMYGGSEVQSYGPISPPGNGTATQPAIDNSYWYTARCVND